MLQLRVCYQRESGMSHPKRTGRHFGMVLFLACILNLPEWGFFGKGSVDFISGEKAEGTFLHK